MHAPLPIPAPLPTRAPIPGHTPSPLLGAPMRSIPGSAPIPMCAPLPGKASPHMTSTDILDTLVDDEMRWIVSLNKGSKLDILDTKKARRNRQIDPRIWQIGTIIHIEQLRICIHVKGIYGSSDAWFNFSDVSSSKLQPLHTHTPYHDDEIHVTACISRTRWDNYNCITCDRKCCERCFKVATLHDRAPVLRFECKDCASLSRYQYLFAITELMYNSIFRDHRMEIMNVKLITKYSFDDYYKKGEPDKSPELCSIDLSFILNYIPYIRSCKKCGEESVSKYVRKCGGVQCPNYYCDTCWIPMNTNKCACIKGVKCFGWNNILCNDCYAGKSICSKCRNNICGECKSLHIASGCTTTVFHR